MTTATYTYGTHKPTNYTRKSFVNAYRQQASWNWFAAARRIGVIEDERDYVAQCMHKYDMLKDTIDEQDIDAVRQLGFDIINLMRDEIRHMGRGRLHARTQEDGSKRIEPFFDYILDTPVHSEDPAVEETVGSRLGEVDHAFDEVEGDSVMDERLAIVADVMHPEDYKALLMYVNDEADSFHDACLQLGHTEGGYATMRARMRRNCASIKGADAFTAMA